MQLQLNMPAQGWHSQQQEKQDRPCLSEVKGKNDSQNVVLWSSQKCHATYMCHGMKMPVFTDILPKCILKIKKIFCYNLIKNISENTRVQKQPKGRRDWQYSSVMVFICHPWEFCFQDNSAHSYWSKSKARKHGSVCQRVHLTHAESLLAGWLWFSCSMLAERLAQ